jgi:S-adenosylmethionine:tRNA ribosyltransferase-isomerase
VTVLALERPRRLDAHEPPEARGIARDDVRMLAATRHDSAIVHARFRELPRFLAAGDLLVVNTSATLPAALPARRASGVAVEVRLSTRQPGRTDDRWWLVELRAADRSRVRDGQVNEVLALPAGGRVQLVAPHAGARLWLAHVAVEGTVEDYLHRHGRPIRYDYVPDEWPLEDYQTAFALEPGSAEMPSAGRPFTPEVITRLVAGGVLVAPVTLHTGVSSPERNEPPYRERYRVPAETARLVNAVRGWGGRVIAVGTTVVRALESAAEPEGRVTAREGWTGLVVTRERGLRAVDGLLTGWHDPEASHVQLLQAALGDELLDRSYAAALERGYLWHEFGDVHLILP